MGVRSLVPEILRLLDFSALWFFQHINFLFTVISCVCLELCSLSQQGQLSCHLLPPSCLWHAHSTSNDRQAWIPRSSHYRPLFQLVLVYNCAGLGQKPLRVHFGFRFSQQFHCTTLRFLFILVMNLALIIKRSRNASIELFVYPICYENLLQFICNHFKDMICNLLWSNTCLSLGAATLQIKKDAMEGLFQYLLGILLKFHTVKTEVGRLLSATYAMANEVYLMSMTVWHPRTLKCHVPQSGFPPKSTEDAVNMESASWIWEIITQTNYTWHVKLSQ